MLSKQIVESDAFLDMPSSSQNLYVHIVLNCDDRGFCGSPRKVARLCGASPDDMSWLAGKGFLLLFDSGVCAVKHWEMMNSVRKDRFHETPYLEELSMLEVKENGSYTFSDSQHQGERLPSGCQLVVPSEVKSSQENLSEVRERTQAPTAPTLEEVKSYCSEKGYSFSPERFHSLYASQGWKRNGTSITDWRSLCDYWQSTERDRSGNARTESISSEYDGAW